MLTQISRLIIIAATLSVGCSQTPRYGVIRVEKYQAERHFSYALTDLSKWRSVHQHPVIFVFAGPPGDYESHNFKLKEPSGEERVLSAIRDENGSEWRVVHDISKKLVDPRITRQLQGDFYVNLLFMLDSPPTSDHVLIYSPSDRKTATYRVSKRALRNMDGFKQ